MGTSAYDPRSYWNQLVTGDGRLSNVGQPALGAYNSYAYRSRLRSLKKALEGLDLGRMKVFEAAFGEGFYLAYRQSQRVPVVAGMEISEATTEASQQSTRTLAGMESTGQGQAPEPFNTQTVTARSNSTAQVAWGATRLPGAW